MYTIPTHPTDSGSSFTEVKNMVRQLMKAIDVMEKDCKPLHKTLDENKETKNSKMEDQKTNPVFVMPEATAVSGATCGELPPKSPPKALIEAADITSQSQPQASQQTVKGKVTTSNTNSESGLNKLLMRLEKQSRFERLSSSSSDEPSPMREISTPALPETPSPPLHQSHEGETETATEVTLQPASPLKQSVDNQTINCTIETQHPPSKHRALFMPDTIDDNTAEDTPKTLRKPSTMSTADPDQCSFTLPT
jgi:hypothetical protein